MFYIILNCFHWLIVGIMFYKLWFLNRKVTFDFHHFVSTYACINKVRFRKEKRYHSVHSDSSIRWMHAEILSNCFINVFRENVVLGEVFPRISLCSNMASQTALVWNFWGGLFSPLVVWTYGEFIQIWLLSDVCKCQSQKKNTIYFAAALINIYWIKNII